MIIDERSVGLHLRRNVELCTVSLLVIVLSGLVPRTAIAQSYSRTESVQYYDNTEKWVLGQTASVTCVTSVPTSTACDGDVVSASTFDAVTGVPLTKSAFGKLQEAYTYSADGTLATVRDGNGNISTLSDWKRGIPQLIRYPATQEAPSGATKLADVDNNGWILSVTDELGAKTCYGHDVLGRVNLILQPSEAPSSAACDDSAWEETTIEFRPMTAAEWRPPGIEPGQWRQYTATGNHQKVVYFDAMWRPVLTNEYDASNMAGTLRAFSTTYDVLGRPTFVSYPSSDIVPAASGTWTFYDSLGRVVEVRQDSEQGTLITKTQYLPYQVRVTGPNDQVALTTFQAFDRPSLDAPVVVAEPLGRTTIVSRDPHGKPFEIERKL
jgi:hypothetical protein